MCGNLPTTEPGGPPDRRAYDHSMVCVLAVSDEVDERLCADLSPVRAAELIVACGDLPFDYLGYLMNGLDVPLVFVPGNHDPNLTGYRSSRAGLTLRAGMPARPPWPDGAINADRKVVEAAGLRARKPVGLLVAPVERDHPLFWMEQFCPLLPVVRAKDSDAAIDLGIQAEGGNRHTSMIYSNFPPNVERFAREVSTVVTVVNGCSLRGLGAEGEGYPGFAIGTVTGEGITSPRHFAQVRRVARIR